MAWGKSSNLVSVGFVALLSVLVTCPTSFAQRPLPDAPVPTPAVEPASTFVSAPPPAASQHKFWDHQNKLFLATAAALNGADFAVTRSNLQNGGRELNPIVRMFGRSTRGLTVNFVGETAGVVTLSYFFHKTGHHKLERCISVVDIGASAGAVSYGLTQR